MLLKHYIYGTEEEMSERVGEGYFIRDYERNLVYCQEGRSSAGSVSSRTGTYVTRTRARAATAMTGTSASSGASAWDNKEVDGVHLLPAGGMRKVIGEFALMCLGYNIKRVKSLIGFEK